MVVALIGTLAAIAVPAHHEAVERARSARAIAEVRAMSLELKSHEVTDGRLPDSLAQIGLGGLTDPWGSPYQYLKIAGSKSKGGVRKDHKLNPLNSDFDLFSLGPDRASRTQISQKDSLDDIIRANDGGFVGLARDY